MLYSLQGHIAEEDHALLLNSITFNIWLFVKICLCIRQCNHELFDYDQAGPRGQNPTDHTVVYFHHSHNGLWWEFPDIVLRLAKGMFIRKIFPTWKIHCGTRNLKSAPSVWILVEDFINVVWISCCF